MKIIALISIFVCSTYLGLALASSTKKRVRILQEFVNFLSYSKTAIKFLNKNKEELVNDYIALKYPDFKKILTSYVFSQKECNSEYKKDINLLNLPNEYKENMILFFDNFGHSDIESEIELIDRLLYNFNQILVDEEKTANINSSLYKKLCSLFGVFVCILFI